MTCLINKIKNFT